VAFANAFNIADGLDGLASGLLLICLAAFLAITSNQVDQPLGIFIAILMVRSEHFYISIFIKPELAGRCRSAVFRSGSGGNRSSDRQNYCLGFYRRSIYY